MEWNALWPTLTAAVWQSCYVVNLRRPTFAPDQAKTIRRKFARYKVMTMSRADGVFLDSYMAAVCTIWVLAVQHCYNNIPHWSSSKYGSSSAGYKIGTVALWEVL